MDRVSAYTGGWQHSSRRGGWAPATPCEMEVSNNGTTDLDQFVMFLVDTTKPFTSPAEFPSA
jgi:hypothetical protein